MRQEFRNRINRLLFGPPKRTDQSHHERLSVFLGVAVFSADALSSVAYATDEIMHVLMLAGAQAVVYSLPVGLAIVALVLIVAASYQQTIHAYPRGGGSYIVAGDNLGSVAGLTAGAAILIDYVLTVAVSASAGMQAVTAALPALAPYTVELVLASVWLIAWINLRGVRESGVAFSVPVYGFVTAMALLAGVGIYRAVFGGLWQPHVAWTAGFALGSLMPGMSLFMLLWAFSSGCTALTGLEAVSDGVMAFKPPEAVNASKTMTWERTILYIMFGSITIMAYGFNLVPMENNPIISQMAEIAFGGRNVLYFVIQAFTTLILVLAANTAYADFPRLASFIARDGYLPHKLAHRGDQLVYRGGILLLATAASVLVILFKGRTHLLIPLYAIGVFIAFTLSQTGMVVHWFKQTGISDPRAALRSGKLNLRAAAMNALGAAACAVVAVIIAVTKFAHGAWIVIVILPILVAYFLSIKRYYRRFRAALQGLAGRELVIDDPREVKTILAVGDVTPVTDHALNVARRTSPDVTAVFVAEEPADGERLRELWNARHPEVPLVVLNSPYRTIVGPMQDYVQDVLRSKPGEVVHLILPVVVTTNLFDAYLHNGTADELIRQLRYTPNLMITEVPFQVTTAVDGTPGRAPSPEVKALAVRRP